MNIAFDKDGTMTNLKYIPIGKGAGKKKKTILDTSPDLTYQNNPVIRKLLCKAMVLYTRICPYREGMSDLAKRLIESGDKTFMITSTCMGTSPYIEGDIIRKEVEISLLDNDIPFSDIIFTKSNKVKECLDNKIDIIVEDNAENIIALREAGITTIRFIEKRNNHIINDDGFAANNLYEVEKIINRIKEEQKEKLKNQRYHINNANNSNLLYKPKRLELKLESKII